MKNAGDRLGLQVPAVAHGGNHATLRVLCENALMRTATASGGNPPSARCFTCYNALYHGGAVAPQDRAALQPNSKSPLKWTRNFMVCK